MKYQPDDSIKRKPEVAVGIFPLYGAEIEYVIRPIVNIGELKREGKAILIQESAIKEDPFLAENPNGFDFLFFKKSPFGQNHPYGIDWSEKDYEDILYPKFYELSFEENLINHTLWCLNYLKHYHIKPELFKKSGFASFINSQCSNPRYVELHAAFTQFLRRKSIPSEADKHSGQID